MCTGNGRPESTPPPRTVGPAGGASTDLLQAIDRHPSALGRHLDNYLASVAREVRDGGIVTGSPRRTDPAYRLIGSIVLDCTALRLEAGPPDGRAEWPEPVVLTWDERLGWCVGLHHDPTRSSRRYLHPDLLPSAPAVAEFVVGLAMGQPLGAAHPIATREPHRPRLRLVP